MSVERLETQVREILSFPNLYDYQKQILSAIINEQDAMGILPTGSGKSLCYIAPALSNDGGMVLVISPLIALMRDQVYKLSQAGIQALTLDSGQEHDERLASFERLSDKRVSLVFTSPEKLAQKSFRDYLLKLNRLKLIAIDEAHCVSQWGQRFRPEYRKLGLYLADFKGIPKLALTATASKSLQQDIQQVLQLKDPLIVKGQVLRSNLKIQIFRTESLDQQLSMILNSCLSQQKPGIIYAPTRKRVQELAEVLRQAGCPCRTYHAGLPTTQRDQTLNEFQNQDIIVVATNAFGLGIDKKNVRFVFHYGMPASLEQYIQEIGRAGRDQHPAHCYLFYGGRDFYIQKFLLEQTFPETALLKKCYDKLLFHYEHFHQRTLEELAELIRDLCQNNKRIWRSIRSALTEEGLISLTPTAQQTLIDFPLKDLDCDGFFHDYDSRRQQQFERLYEMLHYIKLPESERMQYLVDYFS